ncbi:MAG: hypothetical protein PHT96_10915 [Syntrophorhabdaceae bacterium]|nr:hypothetical protein [Syntrophorhabdaceae bacterium]MDD4196899.1 hypothetical protein [Syntrophorhabdaceae bacterium]HOC46502.1 hypothetical protein [Syntrophorhabdaceae bacterium]
MPYRKSSQWIVVCLSTAIALFCLSILMASLRTGDIKNAWVFSAFSAIFVIPLLVTVFHMIADRSPYLAKMHMKYISLGQKHKTTFIPHWFVMSGMILIGLIMLYTIIKWLFMYFQR